MHHALSISEPAAHRRRRARAQSAGPRTRLHSPAHQRPGRRVACHEHVRPAIRVRRIGDQPCGKACAAEGAVRSGLFGCLIFAVSGESTRRPWSCKQPIRESSSQVVNAVVRFVSGTRSRRGAGTNGRKDAGGRVCSRVCRCAVIDGVGRAGVCEDVGSGPDAAVPERLRVRVAEVA